MDIQLKRDLSGHPTQKETKKEARYELAFAHIFTQNGPPSKDSQPRVDQSFNLIRLQTHLAFCCPASSIAKEPSRKLNLGSTRHRHAVNTSFLKMLCIGSQALCLRNNRAA